MGNDESGFQFSPDRSAFNPGEELNSYGGDNSFNKNQIRRIEPPANSGPVRTAGVIQLKELQADDLQQSRFIGRDASIQIEDEMRQFDQKRFNDKSVLGIQRYVESLVTGNFLKV